MSTVLVAHGYKVVSADIADCGFGTQVLNSWQAGVSETNAAASLRTLPMARPRRTKGSPDHRRQWWSFCATRWPSPTVQGQLALLVRLQWIAGKRVAQVMTAAPFAAVLVLTQRIQWFDMGARTNAGQHHHAWVVFDHAHPPGCSPALLYA
jgi:hypothetical protein